MSSGRGLLVQRDVVDHVGLLARLQRLLGAQRGDLRTGRATPRCLPGGKSGQREAPVVAGDRALAAGGQRDPGERLLALPVAHDAGRRSRSCVSASMSVTRTGRAGGSAAGHAVDLGRLEHELARRGDCGRIEGGAGRLLAPSTSATVAIGADGELDDRRPSAPDCSPAGDNPLRRTSPGAGGLVTSRPASGRHPRQLTPRGAAQHGARARGQPELHREKRIPIVNVERTGLPHRTAAGRSSPWPRRARPRRARDRDLRGPSRPSPRRLVDRDLDAYGPSICGQRASSVYAGCSTLIGLGLAGARDTPPSPRSRLTFGPGPPACPRKRWVARQSVLRHHLRRPRPTIAEAPGVLRGARGRRRMGDLRRRWFRFDLRRRALRRFGDGLLLHRLRRRFGLGLLLRRRRLARPHGDGGRRAPRFAYGW